MRTRFTRTRRSRAAVTLALAYVLCVLVPSIALAFSGSWAAAHLSIGHHHGAVAIHVDGAKPSLDGGGAAHRHGTHDDPTGTGADGHDETAVCCVYFCVSAVPATEMQDVTPVLGMSAALASVDRGIAGRGPGGIERPPKSHLPL